ncbi:Mss4-like protein [Gymnopilus junonius]|uniref:Mss4-like protein n=1 Tax=Gymnopilus junonius TaxID=109634 RepID=A0A9P5NXR7_GYMJU|nr:Mss4-like protein [Gymnopilus junonius]
MLAGQQSMPPGVLEALRRPSNPSPSSKLISDFPNALSDVLDPNGKREGVSVNKYDLLCPRSDCGSIILKKGVGEWVERASVQMEPLGTLSQSSSSSITSRDRSVVVNHTVTYGVENIGFTRPVQALVESGRLKLLTCAECDLGPLGWCQEGGSEFWLACSRVAYRHDSTRCTIFLPYNAFRFRILGFKFLRFSFANQWTRIRLGQTEKRQKCMLL